MVAVSVMGTQASAITSWRRRGRIRRRPAFVQFYFGLRWR